MAEFGRIIYISVPLPCTYVQYYQCCSQCHTPYITDNLLPMYNLQFCSLFHTSHTSCITAILHVLHLQQFCIIAHFHTYCHTPCIVHNVAHCFILTAILHVLPTILLIVSLTAYSVHYLQRCIYIYTRCNISMYYRTQNII